MAATLMGGKLLIDHPKSYILKRVTVLVPDTAEILEAQNGRLEASARDAPTLELASPSWAKTMVGSRTSAGRISLRSRSRGATRDNPRPTPRLRQHDDAQGRNVLRLAKMLEYADPGVTLRYYNVHPFEWQRDNPKPSLGLLLGG